MKTVLDEWSKETNPIAYSDFLFKQNEDLRKQIERLQEQLKDAEYILDEMGWADRGLIDDYFEKWGVK